MTPIAYGILGLCVLLIFCLDRRYIIYPFLFASILVSWEQVVVVAGLDFNSMRIMVLALWTRLLFIEGGNLNSRLNGIDKMIILYVIAAGITYILLWQTVSAFINRLGLAYSVLGVYFIGRIYFRSTNEVEEALKAIAILSIVISIFMIIEYFKGINLLNIIGGRGIHIVRDEKMRAMSTFGHPISAGCFGSAVFPIAVYLFSISKNRLIPFLAIASSLAIVLASHSSTPALSIMGALLALFLWFFRQKIYQILLIALAMIIALHLLMKAPVWALIDRVGVLAGSHSYHRFLLIDQFIARWNEWWLIGVKSTEHWAHHPSLQLWDVSNEYVRVGVDGGLITLFLFMLIIFHLFKKIFNAFNKMSFSANCQWLHWALGCSVFSYMVSFLGLSLWDQTVFVWFFLISITSSLYEASANANLMKGANGSI